MKVWRIIVVAAFAVISVALITSYPFAAMGGQSTYNSDRTYNPYGSYAPAQATGGNMWQGPMRGMMGSGLQSYGEYQTIGSRILTRNRMVCGLADMAAAR